MSVNNTRASTFRAAASTSGRAATRNSSIGATIERWGTRLFLTVLFLLCVQFNYVLFFVPNKGLNEVRQMAVDVIEQKKKNKRLVDRNLGLKAEVAALKQDYTAIEEHARFKLGMISRDETFFTILGDGTRTPAGASR